MLWQWPPGSACGALTSMALEKCTDPMSHTPFGPFLSAPTQGICVTFVRAQHSSYQWSDADLDRLAAYGHCVHILSDAGLAALTHLPLLSNLCGCCIRKGNHVTYSVVAFIFAPDKTWLPLLPFLPYC